jgi:hypothetical protein
MIAAKLFLHRKLNKQGRKESDIKERGVIDTVAVTDTKEYASLFRHIAHILFCFNEDHNYKSLSQILYCFHIMRTRSKEIASFSGRT